MKIEKINDNQIRCTLNRQDLATRQIKISELAYGTEKAKNLFRDMMRQAQEQFGFEAEDIPLMIEAIPAALDTIILIITKVEDPEELDTRFSKFSSSKEESEFEALKNDNAKDFNNLFDLLSQAKTQTAEPPKDVNFTPLNKALTEEPKKKPKLNEDLIKKTPKDITLLYAFDSLDTLIKAAHLAVSNCQAKTALYKDPSEDAYYLLINKSFSPSEKFKNVVSILGEYGTRCSVSYASGAYIKEHFDTIIPDKAVQKLDLI